MIGYVFLYVRVNLIISMYEVVIVVLVGMVIENCYVCLILRDWVIICIGYLVVIKFSQLFEVIFFILVVNFYSGYVQFFLDIQLYIVIFFVLRGWLFIYEFVLVSICVDNGLY